MIKHHFSPSVPLLRTVVAIAALVVVPILARADVKLPLIFSDHMVLQRDIPIPVWGWADAGEEITVIFGTDRVTTKADANGKWRVNLEKMGANARPQTLTVKGKNTIKFEDVLVGDVWVCSGQSNMEFWLEGAHDADEVVPKANDPLLRLFFVGQRTSIKPQDDVALWNGTRWRACSPEAVAKFTAVGYFFGRELRKHLNIPIGLISSSQGGSMAQLWTSVDAIEKHINADPEFKEWLKKRDAVVAAYPQRLVAYLPAKAKYDEEMKRYRNEVENAPEFVAKKKSWEEQAQKAREEGDPPPLRPQPSKPSPQAPEPPDGGPYNSFMVGNLYNGMISPLIPMAIKGVIWYQGESNDKNSSQYRVLFPIMITDWRKKWGQGDFPFLFVQLPNLSINKSADQPVSEKDNWPGMREAQAKALALPNTGMATTIDVGDPYDVHGKDKLDVGVRLSLVARHLVYDEGIVCTGPTYGSMKVEGNKIRITFKNAGSGLVIGVPPWTPSGKIPTIESQLKGFAIAGEDRKWVWAKAQIDGNDVVVSSESVANPVAVRYDWADNPHGNLYNKEKLPAAPFRTDDWEP